MSAFPAGRGVRLLLAATIFLGAFLLFQVQPLIGKAILPWFGGGPAVWTTSMLFFQVLLLAGYAYAHASIRWLPRGAQFGLHAVLMAAALAMLPVLPGVEWRPTSSEAPQTRILLLLAASVGLPYFVLSATAPLVQAWYARLTPAGSPYRLYALSNVGSLLALLSYPLVFEPGLRLATQDSVWSVSFAVFAVLCLGSAAAAWKWGRGDTAAAAQGSDDSAPITWPHVALWVLLPAAASALYLGATNVICQDVAVFPLLWILPLALYLLTFILCFESTRWYRRDWFLVAAYAVMIYSAQLLSSGPNTYYLLQLVVYSTAMFVGCMVCHGEAVRLKPAPQHLTFFYLCISLGGALGGVLAGIVAPRVFLGYYEFHAALLATWVLALVVMFFDPQSVLYRGKARDMWAILLAMSVVFGWKLYQSESGAAQATIARKRNFYGTLAVTEIPAPNVKFNRRELRHGKIIHGSQFVDKDFQHLPLRYYSPRSGLGLAFDLLPRTSDRRVAIVGLGAGTIATYGLDGDEFRFYEINPDVVKFAQEYFTYLQNSAAKVQIVEGDARVKLADELSAAGGAPPAPFDLIVLDAFSGDAVPAHLLTREAFELYLKRLAPDGIIAAHISSLHLDLSKVLAGHAKDLDLHGLVVEDVGDTSQGEWPSVWVLLSRDARLLNEPKAAELLAATARLKAELPTNPDLLKQVRRMASPLVDDFSAGDDSVRWTDDFSNVLSILRGR
ncbi:MAG: fused MFS/spermidine synthase [Pirellulales bacterium]